ncbi:hypothetical protein [Phenylobacterium sp.]|uniref:hypothetical protein n=1 Tax=Phenylobacterium sp. TaxID=1871053 RepID=UPI002FC920A5
MVSVVQQGYEIGFETSASDAIRLKWAYQLGLLELGHQHPTHHPGMLLLDEPRQQSSSRVGAYTGELMRVRRIGSIFTNSDYQAWRRREQDSVLIQTLLSGWFLTFVGWCGLGFIWLVTRRRA